MNKHYCLFVYGLRIVHNRWSLSSSWMAYKNALKLLATDRLQSLRCDGRFLLLLLLLLRARVYHRSHQLILLFLIQNPLCFGDLHEVCRHSLLVLTFHLFVWWLCVVPAVAHDEECLHSISSLTYIYKNVFLCLATVYRCFRSDCKVKRLSQFFLIAKGFTLALMTFTLYGTKMCNFTINKKSNEIRYSKW